VAARDPQHRGDPLLTVEELHGVFAAAGSGTVGLEEEILLVDRGTWLPAPAAADVARSAGDPRVKTELPAAQLELATAPHATVADAIAELAALRRALLAACPPSVAPVATPVHPLVGGPSALSDDERSRAMADEYGAVARRQLVGALQVHVAPGDADTALAVYNALRGHLPELAALAAAAPFHAGEDTGLASIRPLLCTLLPRQGVPPAIDSWASHLEDLRWGAATGRVREPGRWWWELRPHLGFGTLEIRVPDTQPTIEAAAAVAGLAHALVCHLAERARAGEELGAPPSWRIGENRWSALRDGVHGSLADLRTGETAPTAARLHALVDAVEGHAPGGLDGVRRCIERNAADALRTAGPAGAVPWLAEVFPP
jgi:glutamate---cysteine ligase / carboxylate-amine ligase